VQDLSIVNVGNTVHRIEHALRDVVHIHAAAD
jgi:hypothetical protein